MDSPIPHPPSPSQGSPAESSQTLPQKYQKLATEYAKLRASASVLKRGLLEEQVKSSELADELLSRDQIIRKNEQEIDSLSFRNTQLEKRVGVLQTELAVTIAKSGSGKSKGLFHKSSSTGAGDASPPIPPPAPVNSELITKIEENIRLQRRVSELEELQSQRVQFESKEMRLKELETQVQNLSIENSQLAHSLQNTLDENEAYRDQVGQLQGKILELNSSSSKEKDPIPRLNVRSQSRNGDFEAIGDENDEDSESSSCPCPLVAPPTNAQETLLEKLKSLEMDKEQWILEYHLLEVRLKRVLGKLDETSKILKTLGYEEPITSPTDNSTTTTTIVGSLESETPLHLPLDPIASTIQSHLMSRIQSLIALLQESDSRALSFYDEVQNLETLLILTNERRLGTEQELKGLREKYQGLESDMELIKENYEGQLVAMSEHVVELNERIHGIGVPGTGKRK